MGQRRKKRIFFWRFFGDFSILAFWSFASLLFHFFFLVCFFGSSVAPDSCLYVALLRLFLRLIVWQQIQKQVLAQSHQKNNSAFEWGASPPTGSATLKYFFSPKADILFGYRNTVRKRPLIKSAIFLTER